MLSMAFSFEVLIQKQSDVSIYIVQRCMSGRMKYEKDSITSLVPSFPSPAPVQFSIVCMQHGKKVRGEPGNEARCMWGEPGNNKLYRWNCALQCM